MSRKYLFLSLATYLFIAIGLYLRVEQYLLNRSLWFDEAMLALNIVERSFLQLLQPLDYNQGVPLLFLFLQKCLSLILGNYDYILRLFPFVAGVLSLFMMYALAQKYLDRHGVVLSVGLFAFSEKLIYYASEVKQYFSDVMVALLLLLIAQTCIRKPIKKSAFIVGVTSRFFLVGSDLFQSRRELCL